MRILVACEYSAVVSRAFRARGHTVWSCDLLPTEGEPEWHYQGDARDCLSERWDMLIAFPPCTDLANSGAQYWPAKLEDGRMVRASEFFMEFVNADHIPKRCIENPQGIMSRWYRKPDQYVHPYHFGEPAMKRTGLRLSGLPLLKHTDVVEPTRYHVSSSCRSDKPHMTSRGTRNPHERSRFFQCIANAMADQWG